MVASYLRYFSSTFLWFFFNPFGLWQGVAQVLGQIVAVGRGLIGPSQPGEPPPLSLPFDGSWTVVKGGVEKTSSHSWSIVAQRYAYDFYVTDDLGKSHRGAGRELEDYYAFGKAVLAPADGTVVEARDDIRDFPHPGAGWIDWRTRDFRGNFILIRHGERAYSLIAHLKQGSCQVNKGDRVQAGQIVGQCGNSGHSTEPHIHFHLQDHPNFYFASGLPIRFVGFEMQAIDAERVERFASGYITADHKVASLPDDQDHGGYGAEAAQLVVARPNALDLAANLILAVLTVLGIVVVYGEIAQLAYSIFDLVLRST